ncbi:unnamed protein product, partial [Mesorhabditis belari]|uniref:Uncharacterized protein n=1 Tax=Mesorhabditis belari TaxID=2138241 RepID=A0AAF3FHR6_9BILA
MAISLCGEPSGLRYIRYIPECNPQCTSAAPIANVLKCCAAHHSSGFGFCTKNNQAICATKDVTYICSNLGCVVSCSGNGDCGA